MKVKTWGGSDLIYFGIFFFSFLVQLSLGVYVTPSCLSVYEGRLYEGGLKTKRPKAQRTLKALHKTVL